MGTTNFDVVDAAGGFKVGGVAVVGIGSPDTGWTADTGTAKKTANTTYTAPDISAAYVEAEVQAIATALQDASRTIMALKAVLLAKGIIGA